MTLDNKFKLAGLGLAFLIITILVINGKTAGFDVAMANFVYSFRNPFLTQIMFGITFLGSTPFITLAALIIGLVLLIKNRKIYSGFFWVTLLSSVAIDNLLKYLVRRPRPEISPLDTGITYSFPSGHAMNSLVFYFLLVYLAHRWIGNKLILGAIDSTALILALLIGFSRAYLGAHYFTDILAGYITGAFVLYAAFDIKKAFFARR